MTRKEQGILDILAQLPWWVSVCAAAVVYIGLKFVFPTLVLDDSLLKPLATVMARLAALLAVLFLLPAVVSAVRSSQMRRMLDAQSGIDSIRSLSWKQ